MNIANLPVASPFHATPLEPRQRVTEFRQLDLALRAGNITEALKIIGILQLNAPNATTSVQKQRDFGHENQTAQDLEVLANALKAGNVPLAMSAFATFLSRADYVDKVQRRSEEQSQSHSNWNEEQEPDEPEKTEKKPESGDSPLDILA
jgi:hypothetical protein